MDQSRPYKNRTVFLIITALCFLLYGNTLFNDYNLDDEWAFKDKGQSGLAEGLKESFTKPFVEMGQLNYGFRPISTALIVVEQALFGQKPAVSHFINVLCYAIVCFLLFLWLSKYVRVNWWLAASVTAVFLFLPIHTEVVNSVKNRDELLSATFGLLFLIQGWKYYEKGGAMRLLLVVVFFAASLLSKQNTLPLMLVLPIGLWLLSALNKKRLLLVFVLPVCTFLGVWQLSKTVFDKKEKRNLKEVVDNPLFGEHTGSDRVTVVVNALGFYLTGMVSTEGFGAFYGQETIDFMQLHLRYLIAVILAVLIGFVLLFLFFRRRKYALPFFGMIFMLGCIAPFTNFWQKMPGVVGERLAFLSSMGFAILLGFVVYKFVHYLKEKGKTSFIVSIVCLSAVVLFWSAKTVRRNADWKNLETLISADLDRFPNSVKFNMIMGSIEFNKGVKKTANAQQVTNLEQVELGYDHFCKALETYDKHPAALYNVAWIDTYIREANLDSTAARWRQLVEMGTLDSAEIIPHIAAIETRRLKPDEALDVYMEACEGGDHALGLTGIRQALINADWDAFSQFSECLYADIGERRAQLTKIWKGLIPKDPERSDALIKSLIKKDDSPYYAKVYAQQLMLQSRFPEAMAVLNELDQRFPDDAEIKLLFGNMYMSYNQKENALKMFRQALELNPENTQLRRYIESLEVTP